MDSLILGIQIIGTLIKSISMNISWMVYIFNQTSSKTKNYESNSRQTPKPMK